jgi:hypothetical protein
VYHGEPRFLDFCPNAAKTWANKWYEIYHMTVNPSSGTYDDILVGINAVKAGTITQQQGRISLSRLIALEKQTYALYSIGREEQTIRFLKMEMRW